MIQEDQLSQRNPVTICTNIYCLDMFLHTGSLQKLAKHFMHNILQFPLLTLTDRQDHQKAYMKLHFATTVHRVNLDAQCLAVKQKHICDSIHDL